MTVFVRPAVAADADLIVQLIGDLSEYEKLSHEMSATAADIAAALFSDVPRVFCEIADLDGEPVGLALWFYSYSTFRGRFGLYLEDLYVRPPVRGRGVGKALLASLARRCVEENLGRMDWSVLHWNTPSIGFYESLGARLIDEWIGCRLEGEHLAALAGS